MSEKITREINYPLGDDFGNKEALSLEDNLELSQNLNKADLGNQLPGQNVDSDLSAHSFHPVSIPVLPGISEHIPTTWTKDSEKQRPAKK